MRVLFWNAVLALASIANANPIETIYAKYATPVTPIGGVLSVPLLAETPGTHWPSELAISLDNGQQVPAFIGWIENSGDTSWTATNRNIRQILPTDDTSAIQPYDSTTGPVLYAQLPDQFVGTITIGNSTIEPIWHEVPKQLPNINITPVDSSAILQPTSPFAFPTHNALAFWRVTLLASREGVLPYKPNWNSTVESLAATHQEQLWRIGLDRLARSSRSAAAECRDLLTNTSKDGETVFACWVTDSEQQLLNLLLDTNITARQLALRALRWCDEQQPYVFWLEQVYGNEIILAVTNPTLEPILAAIKWREGNDIPIVVEIPSNETIRIPFNRKDTFDASIFGPETLESSLRWLEVQLGNYTFSLPVVPEQIQAMPPSVTLPTLYPSWTLQSIRSQKPVVTPKNDTTTVELRKLFGQWEIFVTCSSTSSDTAQSSDVVLLHNNKTDSTVRIVPQEASAFGWTSVYVVPELWIDNETLAFSAVRKDAISPSYTSSPLPCVPWRTETPAPIYIDVSKWDEITSFPTSQ